MGYDASVHIKKEDAVLRDIDKLLKSNISQQASKPNH